MKYWDTTALTRWLYVLRISPLADIDKAYNTAFYFCSKVLTNKQEEVIHSIRQSMNVEIGKLAIIILDFTIQQKHMTVFLKKKIIYLPLITKKIYVLKF